MKAGGFGYMDLEPAPASLPQSDHTNHGYGIYSARYGNVYTTRQLLQLFNEAFDPQTVEMYWLKEGRYYDPFRPNIQPGGYATHEELKNERAKHLQMVRTMFEELDVFIFTMGLTEAWRSKEDGYVYPLCPGVAAGKFDESVHEFVNFSYTDVYDDFILFYEKLKNINPKAKILLTVSPVPLTATADDAHVLVATIHSKSILRAVAGELSRQYSDIDYFPSYEIITGHNFKGMFFKQNLRNIHDEGVDFVMSHFFREHMPDEAEGLEEGISCACEDFCDEVLLDISKKVTHD